MSELSTTPHSPPGPLEQCSTASNHPAHGAPDRGRSFFSLFLPGPQEGVKRENSVGGHLTRPGPTRAQRGPSLASPRRRVDGVEMLNFMSQLARRQHISLPKCWTLWNILEELAQKWRRPRVGWRRVTTGPSLHFF